MKRCPECRRDYFDDTLSFCLDDGAGLFDGPATADFPTAQLAAESATALFSEAPVSNVGPKTTWSSADLPAGRASNRTAFIGIAALILLAFGGIGFAVYKFAWPLAPVAAGTAFQSIKIERLTANGKATEAVVSPDAKQVVYVVDDGGRRSLWLRQVATASDVQLAAPDNIFYLALTISPDGDYLYFIYGGTTIRNRVLYQMPLVGGNPKKIIEDVGSPVGFSPDGKQIAFVRAGDQQSAMIIANSDGTGEREIYKQKGIQSLGTMFAGGTAWSPDGKKIFSVARKPGVEGGGQSLVEISIADGTLNPVTPQSWYEIQRMALLPDGSGFLITAAEKAADFRSRQIWFVPYPSGEARKVTHDLNNYSSISLNADATVMLTVQEDETASIWVAPDGDAARATELKAVSGKLDGYDGLRWTPDGRIVYTSMAGGNGAIWIMDADGKNRKQLSRSQEMDYYPSVSSDGRYIVFNREVGRARKVWRMDIDGGNARELFQGNNPQTAGEWIVFGTADGIMKAPIEGGDPVPVASEVRGRSRCAVSNDNKLIACQLDTPGEDTKLVYFPIDGSSPAKVFDVKFELPARIRWARDGRAINFISREAGIRDIWSQPIEGGEPKRITNFKSDQIFSFDYSPDGKLVISHGESTSDVVMIKNAK
jgi:eukaryotic-like serine/threonine-protein kinase